MTAMTSGVRQASTQPARKSFPTVLNGLRFSALTAVDGYQMMRRLGIKDF
jgi:hypothetical protein